MSTITMKELLEAGVHFGHQAKRWNPKMKKYIFGERNGIYIIDLQKTLKLFKEAYDFVRNESAQGKDILFVGTSTSAGYFTNFGKTQRQGFELGLNGSQRSVDWRIGYSYLQATFQSSACLLSQNNSSRSTAPECTARWLRPYWRPRCRTIRSGCAASPSTSCSH